MLTTIYGFFKDDAFKNLDAAARQENSGGALGLPSYQSLSYFSDAGELGDTRAVRDWVDVYTATTRPVVLIDTDQYTTLFGTDFSTIDQAHRDALFDILDRVFIHIVAGDDIGVLETDLTTDVKYNTIYTAATLALSPGTRVEGTLYNAANTLVAAPPWVSFSVSVNSSLNGLMDLDFKIWIDDASFKADYPVTTITAVVSNLSYNDILTSPLTGGGFNMLDTASVTAELIAGVIDSPMHSTHQTGLYEQPIKLYDSAQNARLYPIGILHKGLVPDLLSIRTAIREAAVGSGFGTEASWRARAPELFIVDQFYIVPMWDVVTTSLNGSINPSVVNVAQMRASTKTALPSLTDNFVDANLESMSVVYNAMQVANVPHPDNLNYTSIYQVHPTYQNYAATEPGFSQMDEATRTFSNRLNTALAVAAGAVADVLYPPRVDGGNTYIPFVVGTTEYYVITKDSYLDRVGV